MNIFLTSFDSKEAAAGVIEDYCNKVKDVGKFFNCGFYFI
jgi:hypothetical protein